jgi:hypothetical protein
MAHGAEKLLKAKPARRLAVMPLTASLACILASCASETPDQIRLADEQRCIAQGYQPGTEPLAECLRREHYQIGQAAGPWWGPPFGSGDW